MEKEKLRILEEEIDNYIFNRINDKYPRYKYIYHLNLAYIDLLIDRKMLFTPFEKHLNFALSSNIHWAYKKLLEEEKTEYDFDRYMYLDCWNKLIEGFKYSILCEEFPRVHSNLSKLIKLNDNTYKFEGTKLPREQYMFIHNYSKRHMLSCLLQYIAGKPKINEDEDKEWILTKNYLDFWAEQLQYEDYKLYKREEWGGVSLYLILATMRRWIKLYECDFDMRKIHPTKLMIVMSKKWEDYIPEYINSNLHSVELVLNDFTFKPLGKELYPKCNIHEAPIIRTKDDFLFINPFTILFTDQDSRYLSFIRKFRNQEYCELKNQMKERHMPFIIEVIKRKYPSVKIISNFNILIPNTKNTRELDLFLFDEIMGFGLYIEMKYYYNPISFSEYKSLDSEFKTALSKLPQQLNAIKFNWDDLKNRYNLNGELCKLEGIILSYEYLGLNVEINPKHPIVNTQLFYESISASNSLEELFLECKDVDEVYNMPVVKKKSFSYEFAGYNFISELEYFDPSFEFLFKNVHRERADDLVKLSREFHKTDAHQNLETAVSVFLGDSSRGN